MNPPRTRSLWLTASASPGASRSVGTNRFDQRMPASLPSLHDTSGRDPRKPLFARHCYFSTLPVVIRGNCYSLDTATSRHFRSRSGVVPCFSANLMDVLECLAATTNGVGFGNGTVPRCGTVSTEHTSDSTLTGEHRAENPFDHAARQKERRTRRGDVG